MADDNLTELAAALLDSARKKRLKIATAESCTGGMVASTLIDIPGSSRVVDRGYITYSNVAKEEELGVPHEMLVEHGAVSEPVVRAMAAGALRQSGADIVVGITGVAGPGGTADKPAGTVHFAAANKDKMIHELHQFGDIGRNKVRRLSVEVALKLMQSLV